MEKLGDRDISKEREVEKSRGPHAEGVACLCELVQAPFQFPHTYGSDHGDGEEAHRGAHRHDVAVPFFGCRLESDYLDTRQED